jgi:hypothetical protein
VKTRTVFHLFDHVFKLLMNLSNPAVISFINGLFGTSHPLSSPLLRPSTETVEPSLKLSQADMVLTIADYSYLVETQISNDQNMSVRLFQYILNQGRRNTVKNSHVLRVKLPAARVIYWETTPSTPDKETLEFEFPDGTVRGMDIPSFKFPEFGVRDLEERGMEILLPFCMVRLRKGLKEGMGEEEQQELGVRMKALVREVAEAGERSERRGVMSRGDVWNMLQVTRSLQGKLYKDYTEQAEEQDMWEDIKLYDYDGVLRRLEALEEANRQIEERVVWEKEKATREKEIAALKLREMGVSAEQLAAAGLL